MHYRLKRSKLIFSLMLAAVLAVGLMVVATDSAEACPGCPPELFGCPFDIEVPTTTGGFCCVYQCPNGSRPEYCSN